MNNEIWKTVNGYGLHYEASNIGRIRSKDRIVKKYSAICGMVVDQAYAGKVLSQKIDKWGYARVHIGVDGNKYSVQVGRLVLMAFVGMPEEGQECCHNNGNSQDNSIENLRWDTHLNNNRDRIKHNTYKRGSAHHYAKYSDLIRDRIGSGAISKKEAMEIGVSNTHFYRIKNKYQLALQT